MTTPLKAVVPAVVVLMAWEAASQWRPATYGFFLGSPRGILAEVVAGIRDGTLLRHIGVTGLEALAGFAIGTALGTIVGLTFWYSDVAYAIAKPYLVALGAVPIFALAPMMIFWFGTGMFSKIVMGFLSTFVIAVLQARNGAASADRDLLRMARSFGASRRDVFVRIIVPSASLWVLAGIRLNVGMALLGAFVGELVSSRAGLGHLIIVAEGLFNVNQIWIGILGMILIALALQALVYPAERWAVRWS